MEKHFKLSKKASSRLQEIAITSGLTETTVIEQLLMGYVPNPKPSDELFTAIKELCASLNGVQDPTVRAEVISLIREIENKYIWSIKTNGSDEAMGSTK